MLCYYCNRTCKYHLIDLCTFVFVILTLDDQSLGERDLGNVVEEVFDAHAKWYDLGLQLGVQGGTLDGIRNQFQNPKDALREMLMVWLKMVDPKPTWTALIDALRSRTVGKYQLAQALEHKYCPILSAAGKLSCMNVV